QRERHAGIGHGCRLECGRDYSQGSIVVTPQRVTIEVTAPRIEVARYLADDLSEHGVSLIATAMHGQQNAVGHAGQWASGVKLPSPREWLQGLFRVPVEVARPAVHQVRSGRERIDIREPLGAALRDH